MPKGKGRRGKKKNKGRKSPSAAGPSAAATSYHGPIMINPSAAPRTRVIRLTDVFNVTFAAVPGSLRWTNDPSATSEWSQASATWEEFRVLSQRLRFVPYLQNFTNTPGLALTYGTVVWFVQRNSGSPAPVSMTSAFQFDTARPANIQTRQTITARASTATEMLFQNVTSTSATWTIGVTTDVNTALNIYGQVYIELLVQFRSKD